MEQHDDQLPHLVLVVSSGRSGTSTVAGILDHLGLILPTPQIAADESNPKGFFEPAWVVHLHEGLLKRTGAALEDARPDAFEIGDQVGARGGLVTEVTEWLEPWMTPGAEIVIKDPRSTYFLDLWRRSATAAGGRISYLTMLRHPAEVVGSKQTHYHGLHKNVSLRSAQTTRVATWINVNLFTELRTRGTSRTFVAYADLLTDWRSAIASVANDLGLSIAGGVPDDKAQAVDGFVEPDLRRTRLGWDDIDCPEQLVEIAEQTWQSLLVLAASGGSDSRAEQDLDALRERYLGLYADATAITRSAIEAARRTGRRQGRRSAMQSLTAPNQ